MMFYKPRLKARQKLLNSPRNIIPLTRVGGLDPVRDRILLGIRMVRRKANLSLTGLTDWL